MELPRYLQVLWGYKWLLVFGAIVAAVAAFFSGFTIENGQPVSRATQTWSATTTMLITSMSDPIYQAEIPGVPIQEGITERQFNNLSGAAIIYAYLIASDQMQEAVEAEVGPLDPDTEDISAMRRTTQPSGDERFPGRYEVPVIEAIGIAETPERAEEISRATADAFSAFMVARQDAQALPPEVRVLVEPLGMNPAEEGEGSNPAIPIVVTFFGVFLAFVVLAFVLSRIRWNLDKRRAARAAAPEDDDSRVAAEPVVAEPRAVERKLPLGDSTGSRGSTPTDELVGTGAMPARNRRVKVTDDGAPVV